MKRAYSLLTIKAVDDDERVIEGIATTPSVDHMGDIVEPKGAEYSLPIPLLWQHDSSQPIGHVEAVKVSDDGITVRARFVKVDEPGALKDRLDEAWQSVKSGLVRGLSIGFKSIEEARINDSWSYRYLRWFWHELSAVTIPANAECSITAVKSADRAQLAASGHRAVVDLSPGASGSTKHIPKGRPTMTPKEQLAALEAKHAEKIARRTAIHKAAADANRTKDDAEREEFDNLTAEIRSLEDEIRDAKIIVEDEVKGAKPAAGQGEQRPARGTSTEVKGAVAYSSPNVEPGIAMARVGMAQIRARQNNTTASDEFRRVKHWMDQTPNGLDLIQRTAVVAGDTTTSGWASQLAYAKDAASEFVEFLRPKTVIGKLGLRGVPFNIRFGTQSAGVSGVWVGQGKPVPVGKPTFGSGSLGIAKAAVICAIDEELAKLSSPSAELLVRDDMAKGVQEYLDRQFLNPDVAASANVSPASITNGVTPVAASGTAAANVRTDIASLLVNLSRTEQDMSSLKLIMAPETAMQIGLMVTSLGVLQFPGLGLDGGTLLGIPVVTSNCANISGSPASGRMIIAAVCNEIMLADEGGMQIDVSSQTALQLDDAPTNASAGSVVATSMVSMFQTHTLALRCTRWINWGKRRSDCVEFIRDAAYAA